MFYIVASTDGAVEQAERKRQKARERYANVPDEPKAENNAKRREDYNQSYWKEYKEYCIQKCPRIVRWVCATALYDRQIKKYTKLKKVSSIQL